jgi:hypothetical protein
MGLNLYIISSSAHHKILTKQSMIQQLETVSFFCHPIDILQHCLVFVLPKIHNKIHRCISIDCHFTRFENILKENVFLKNKKSVYCVELLSINLACKTFGHCKNNRNVCTFSGASYRLCLYYYKQHCCKHQLNVTSYSLQQTANNRSVSQSHSKQVLVNFWANDYEKNIVDPSKAIKLAFFSINKVDVLLFYW